MLLWRDMSPYLLYVEKMKQNSLKLWEFLSAYADVPFWVEEAFGYKKLIYLKYTSKMCEVYFPKVFLKITIGVYIFTNTYIRRLEIVHIFTITKQIIEIVYKSTIFLGHVYTVLEPLVLRLYTNNTISLRLLWNLQSYRHG